MKEKKSLHDTEIDNIVKAILSESKSKLRGMNFSYRSYFDDGVSDAKKGLPYRHIITKTNNNKFISVYLHGYEATTKLLKGVGTDV